MLAEKTIYDEVDELLDEVESELTDPQYGGRTHGIPATGKAGCSGPLCRWAERERGLKRYHAARAAAGTPVVQVKNKPRRRFDDLLARLAQEHWTEKLAS